MICVVIPGPTFAKARHMIAELPKEVKLIELRLDLIEDWSMHNITHLKEDFPELNVIFTLRPIEQGGASATPLEERLDTLCELSKLNPEYIDVEFGSPPDDIQKIKSQNPHTKIILSHHEFTKMPDLKKLLAEMKSIPADLYKIAVRVDSTLEALKLLLFMRDNPGVVVSGMGVYGRVTRILSPVFNGPFVYASFDDNASVLPGQLSASELLNTYNFERLNPQTKIFALIGEPLDRSPSTIIYNAWFKKMNIPAVYVKLPMKEESVDEFLELIKKIPIKGLSVTSPIKELIYDRYREFGDEKSHQIGAVNTVDYNHDTIHCYNTDGEGAVDALEKFGPLDDKKMLVIGAGGAVKSLILAALKKGAMVIILNRTPGRAQKVASELNCLWDNLENIKMYYRDGYDILVNGTTVQPIEDDMILPGSIVFDLQIFPTDTKLLNAARKKGCKIVNGFEMWVNQGANQMDIWFGPNPETKQFISSYLKKTWDLQEF